MNTLAIFGKNILKVIFIGFSTLFIGITQAQDVSSYPNKPIRLIVGFSAGGISSQVRALLSKINQVQEQRLLPSSFPNPTQMAIPCFYKI